MAKADGKQGVNPRTDQGAHEAFQKATSPQSVKSAAQGKTPYKHR